MTLAKSKRAGERVEATVIEAIPELEPVANRDDWRDARTTTLLEPSNDLGFVGINLLERETDVEIKSCMVVATSDQAHGRFYLRRSQHDQLLDAAGSYLFAVATPNPSRDVLAMCVLPATALEDVVGTRDDDSTPASWLRPDGRAEYAQVAWTRLFHPDVVEDRVMTDGGTPSTSSDTPPVWAVDALPFAVPDEVGP